MYFLVLLLDALGAVMLAAILHNFGELNLAIAIFFSIFPLGFALLSELLKIEALVTGTTEQHWNIVRVVGFMIVLVILVLGVYPPFRDLWVQNANSWTQPVLVWMAFIAFLLLIIPAVQEVRARHKIRYKKLMEQKILP